jgi:membrane-bound lytic murein transglycosylase B
MKHLVALLPRPIAALAFCLAVAGAHAEAVVVAPDAAATAAAAEPAPPSPFQTWLDGFRLQAAAQGISQATLDAALTGLQPLEKVVEADRRQPEFLDTFLDYLDKRLSDTRLRGGQEMLAREAALLGEVERRYGIPARYLVAFWGLETNYGTYMGTTPTIAALATLAFDTRRPGFFRGQLLDALRILDRGQLTTADLVGSWAGAIGHMQFIPSTWLAYAVDGDGDGRIDLRASFPDALHSAANYLRQAGWRSDEEWGMEVRLPAGFDLGHAGLERQKPVNSWSFLGLLRPDGSMLPDSFRHASLVLPQGVDGPAFLVLNNFRVILRWNNSINYALAVGHLADRLAGGPPLAGGQTADGRRLNRSDMETLQKCLAMLGYDPGPADGIPGSRTRSAIRAYQAAVGLPADGYPSVPLLERLQDNLLEQAPPLPGEAAPEAMAGPA